MSEHQLANAADENLAVHFSYVQARLPAMRVLQEVDLVASDSGLPCDTFNAACRARLTSDHARMRIDAVLRWFAETRHPFSWWHGPADTPTELHSLLCDAGLSAAERELAMQVSLTALPELTPPAGFAAREVRTTDELAHFARLNAANWTPPDPHVLAFYRAAGPVVLRPESPLRYFLMLAGDEPVSALEITTTANVLGIYGVSTDPRFRRRGLASALIVSGLRACATPSSTHGVLQAAKTAVGVYERLGFRSFGEITEYKPRS